MANELSVLIVRGAWGEIYEPAWQRALTDLGIKAEIFDCHRLTSRGLAGRMERRLLAGPGIHRIRRQLIEYVEASRPDVVLLYQGHYLDKATVERLSEMAFVTGYHNDDPFGQGASMLRYRHFHRALEKYDGFHVYRPSNVEEMRAARVPNIGLLKPGFLPWADYPREPDTDDVSADLLFAGHCEPDDRVECLLAADAAGLKLRIHGDKISWDRHAPKAFVRTHGPIRPVVGDAYRTAIASSAISLCFFSKKNRDVYTRRVFEITACGGFLLCERTEAMTGLFQEGVSAEYFSNPAELIEKASYYLRFPAERARIAEAGLKEVWRQGHDIHNRMREWLNDIAIWRNKKLLAHHI